MERNLFRYIWGHTRRDQIWIMLVTLMAMVPFYLSFDLPKQIINGPITGAGFEEPGATLPFLQFDFDLPLIGGVTLFDGFALERMPLLFALSFAFLALVIVNGLTKIYINIFKGRLGERLLRRIRFDLIDRILRFPPQRFKSLKAGEAASMVKDEVEPFGGFAGEAFASPVMLAGQTLTALLFIFVQHVGLGLVALAMALIQVLIIPRLRARLIVLGRQRQLAARQLAGRVTEIVDGIDTIRSNDATNYVRADVVDRLGRIFKIRYDIYQWKFFVKFLNNFISQLTPFIFYSFGGYLAITGHVDIGQLVAVINAYKELPGPMKGLIDYDMARQDIQVKYETIVNQFDSDTLIDREKQAVVTAPEPVAGGGLELRGLSLTDDGGAPTLERATLRFQRGERVALIGQGSRGPEELARAIGRIVWPAAGSVQLGERDLLALPDAVSGRRISYAAPDQYFFSGGLGENLLFGLKNAPRQEPTDAAEDETWWREAALAGNPPLPFGHDWVDEAGLLSATGTGSRAEALARVIALVELQEDLSQLALRCPLDPVADADLAEKILHMRQVFADELAKRGLEAAVLRFDPDGYNDAAMVGENIFFGNLVGETAIDALTTSAFVRGTVQETGLLDHLYHGGRQIAGSVIELLGNLPPDHPFFHRLTLFAPEDIPELRQALTRTEGVDIAAVPQPDMGRFIWIAVRYNEPTFRLGLLTDPFKKAVLATRQRVRAGLPDALRQYIEFYDPDRYLFHSDIRENIAFGKPNPLLTDVEAKMAEIGMSLRATHPDTVARVMRLGMGYDVGPAGRRLSAVQRAKLNLARALLRQSEVYVFNRPLMGVDAAEQRRIIEAVTGFLAAREDPPLVIWVLDNPDHADAFGRVIRFQGTGIAADEPTGPREVSA